MHKSVQRMTNTDMLLTIQILDSVEADSVVDLKGSAGSTVLAVVETLLADSKISLVVSSVVEVVVQIVRICHVKGPIFNMSWI